MLNLRIVTLEICDSELDLTFNRICLGFLEMRKESLCHEIVLSPRLTATIPTLVLSNRLTVNADDVVTVIEVSKNSSASSIAPTTVKHADAINVGLAGAISQEALKIMVVALAHLSNGARQHVRRDSVAHIVD